MDKTKKQLRAEAVERLEKLRKTDYIWDDVIEAMLAERDPRYTIVSQLIDLLTDNETPAMDENSEEAEIERLCDNPVVRAFAEAAGYDDGAGRSKAEQDTREKLEADVSSWVDEHMGVMRRYSIDDVALISDVEGWLDRQAAITEREVRADQAHKSWKRWFDFYQPQIDELQAKVDEQEKMLADSREMFSGMRKQRDEMQAKVDEWKAKAEEEKSNADGHWRNANNIAKERDELKDENARLRTCMESDKEQHDEVLAENAALEAELKLARGELKQALNNHAQAEQRMKRKEQELDRKLALPPDKRLKELYELEKRNYEREVAENADLRKVLDGIAKAARSRKLTKEAE